MGKQSICWDCKKSTTGECSWSKELKPVEGWTAKENEGSYCVKKCPEFIRNSWCFGKIRTAEEYIEYLERVVKYRERDIRKLKRDILGHEVWESTHYGEC